jgi:Holliday junction resolvase RusA-like endonuclease
LKIALTIFGECVSKSNSRRLVTIRGRPAFIKSAKALKYVADVVRQVRKPLRMLEGRLRFSAVLYYASERPDLDPSVLLDALQGRLYRNDRQVRELHLVHAIDKLNPRAELLIEEITASS